MSKGRHRKPRPITLSRCDECQALLPQHRASCQKIRGHVLIVKVDDREIAGVEDSQGGEWVRPD